MTLAKYSKKEYKVRRIRQAISKKKNWLIDASLKQSKESLNLPQRIITNTNSKTIVSDLTNSFRGGAWVQCEHLNFEYSNIRNVQISNYIRIVATSPVYVYVLLLYWDSMYVALT